MTMRRSAEELAKLSSIKAEQLIRLRRRRPLLWNSATLFPRQAEALELADLLGTSDIFEEKNAIKFEEVVQQCQERPQALDPVLEDLTKSLIRRVSSCHVARCIYLLCKIRGRKAVAKTLPSGVMRLEECLHVIRMDAWESKYVGLVWLSTLVLVPFNLDAVLEGDDSRQRLVDLCESFLKESRPTREPASLCLARLLTRPDCTTELNLFFNKATLHDIGQSLVLAEVFKRLGTNPSFSATKFLEVSLSRAEIIFLNPTEHAAQERKLALKIIQRAFSASPEVDEAIAQRLIGLLVGCGLSDTDSIVRWSAAKGIARVCHKLGSADMRRQVCCWVLDLFADYDSEIDDDAIWHGASLALAELARTRLLGSDSELIERALTDCVGRALEYDRRRGTRALGSNVRDAACYVCWAVVRSVRPETVRPFANQLYTDLVLCALFDREISCRRAAAAALQESVGRLGREAFPRGIETVQVIDFLNVGNVVKSYTECAIVVAALENTQTIVRDMFDHLLRAKLFHWDEHIRILASKTLRLLSADALQRFNGENIARDAINHLAHIVAEGDPGKAQLHGSLLGMAELLAEFKTYSPQLSWMNIIRSAAKSSLTERFPEIGKAFCALVEALATFHVFSISERDEVATFIILQLRIPETRASATIAMASLLQFAPSSTDESILLPRAIEMADVSMLRAFLMAMRRSPSLADQTRVSDIIKSLESVLDYRKSKRHHLERVEVLDALMEIDDASIILPLLIVAMDDNQTTDKGDVGSWVRRKACALVRALSNKQKVGRQSLEKWEKVRQKCAFLCCDKLDHGREVAWEAMAVLSPSLALNLDDLSLKSTFSQCCILLKDARLRPHVIKGLCLSAGALSESPSVAAKQALTTWALGASPLELCELWDVALESIRDERGNEFRLTPLLKTIGWLLLDNVVFTSPFASALSNSLIWMNAILDECRAVTARTKNVARLVAASRVIVGVGGVLGLARAWVDLGGYMCHPFPLVRKQTFEAIYLWAIGVPDPATSMFNQLGGDLDRVIELIAEAQDSLSDASADVIAPWMEQFIASCPKHET